MSKNIKEIGKELLGKSLNSFHKKTGLIQLEENNKMQDGILNGILSQVDDAYIEKTEQSNVIHLDGSGDGVVVLDSVEGNTMVNCLRPLISSSDFISLGGTIEDGYLCFSATGNYKNFFLPKDKFIVKPSTTYTFIIDIKENTLVSSSSKYLIFGNSQEQVLPTYWTKSYWVKMEQGETGRKVFTLTTKDSFDEVELGDRGFMDTTCTSGNIKFKYMVLEGDWTNKEIPTYFEGLQSSFEENITDEGQYKIEILSNNKNLFNMDDVVCNRLDVNIVPTKENNAIRIKNTNNAGYGTEILRLFLKKGTYSISANISDIKGSSIGFRAFVNNSYGNTLKNLTFVVNYDQEVILFYYLGMPSNTECETILTNIQLEKNDSSTNYTPHKQNKIKLLINEPLRAIDDVRDRLCVKDSKLVIERNYTEIVLDGNLNGWSQGSRGEFGVYSLKDVASSVIADGIKVISDRYPTGKLNTETNGVNQICIYNHGSTLKGQIRIVDTSCSTLNDFKTKLLNNPTKIIYQCEPYYEEVLNEYGVPILLEGYENGILYVDSTIVPTTTVRYTPKMESFNAIKEISNNNTALTLDINDSIIPYMMDVDLMIMQKEMALASHKNIRIMEASDMTNMQKRTGEMLARLIKGGTLTKKECKTRITTYLDANKITNKQAEELNLLINEFYA